MIKEKKSSYDRIEVSIICNTYNHIKYIRDALEGFLKQKTDFALEVLIHDDASTDGTQDIIREYEQKYPELIKPIYQTENQYSQHISITKTYQLPRAQGKYIAMCEGDDYWTDPYKLQKQFDIMEAHPEVDMCAHGAICVAALTGEKVSQICPSYKERILTADEVIRGGGEFLSTNSLFYRKELNNFIPEFRQYLGIDYTLQIHGSLRGGIYFLPEMMSSYRVLTPGSWTDKFQKDENRRIDHFKKLIHMFELLSIDTNHCYDETIQYMILETELKPKSSKEQFRMLHTKKYSTFYKKLPKKEIIKFFLKAYFPWVKKIYKIIKK